jgi:hypothetical protein
VVTLLVMSMLGAALLVVTRGDRESRLATEVRPAAVVACDGAAVAGPECSPEPLPTTTSVAVTAPTPTPPPTSRPSTTVPRPALPLHLEGSDRTLHVVADLDDATPRAGQVVRLRVKIVRQEGVEMTNISFGDRYGGGVPNVVVDCAYPRGSTTSSAPPPIEESTKTEAHAYRVPGTYRLQVDVTATGCRDRWAVRLTGTVVVGPGVTRSNGPLLPMVKVEQSRSSAESKSVGLNVRARDADGFVTDVTVAWGDDATETKQYRLADCVDEKTYWRPTSDTFTLHHTYSGAGDYHVEVTVSSAGCGGEDRQSKVATLVVTAAA